ncbi:MAG: hypothetical protein COT74_11230 [Bdellovibrionales bacterium CG10_big_fil_rev_8_21_14_0_10_45_34]|nr:MAG: hypothetical protein COT74_11230 [Bdellovibrionales bacterium CG10_big_fil_rev_8_21_14_0_10_45_34]
MLQPLIGIALAAYKPEPEYFEVQLKSIEEQSYKNWICYITFDSDPSEVSQILQKFSDKRFRIVQNPHRLGHKKNFQKAAELCLGESADLIAFSDQDDIWMPHKLERSFAEYKKRGPGSLVHCDMYWMQNISGVWKPTHDSVWALEKRGVNHANLTTLMVRNVAAGAASLMDAEIVRNHLEIPDGFEFHDWWYAVVASTKGGVWPIREPLFYYRQHDENVVGASPFVGFFNTSSRIKANGFWQTAEKAWIQTKLRIEAVVKSGLARDKKFDLTYLRKDLGLGLGIQGLRYFCVDRPLARSSFARALGKLNSSKGLHHKNL